ncbi:T9SS type A sorting domain-containing protein [Flavobacterium terrae]|uniref:Conserved repeat domain-containing protein/Por secretion system C-terminal sorting domain-containing protein n=1 Tax=Flavobacterium terrae TaxID=415425 RepID=A0A1M6AF37_9FLAO|nr:T9SS type A sorting domain-containing protein [Flavobacterium terrae]SHI35085.1 conserved repeat domain-containing protein/Por secretion system C-terminal sorting domain-containing protein [Flavobacterium terrae]
MKKQLLIFFFFLSFNAIYAQIFTGNVMFQNPNCPGEPSGLIHVNATGGVPPYTFSVMQNGGPMYGPTSNSVFTNLFAGVYTVNAFDSSVPQQMFSMNVIITEPAPLYFTVAVEGHTVTVSVVNSGNYQYSLDNGPSQSSNIFTNVSVGMHQITVVNENGCVLLQNITVDPLLELSVTSNYVDYNNDGFTNVGDVIAYQFTVTNNENAPITNLTLSGNDLTINGSLATLNPSASDATTFTGTHVITQQDINNGWFSTNVAANGTYDGNLYSIAVIDEEALSITDGIKLNAFVDTNTNGIQDGGEQNFTLGNFQCQMNNNGINHIITASSGVHYIYETNPANMYNVSYSIGNVNPLQYSLGTSSYNNVSVATGSGVTTYNFPVTVLDHKDLEVAVFPNGAPPRPGFTYTNRLMYKNNGNQTIDSGTLTFIKDNAVTITGISQSGTVSGTNGFTYNFTNLLPGEVRYIDVIMQVPTIPTVALGQTITNNFLATISGTDINTSNNASSLTQTIVGSYDPNDKIESHGGKILHSSFTSNDYLTYTIQFENTGTANAVNVRVNDVLDSKLDETTVRMINASHDYALDRVGNNLNWKFNGIELEPSVANTAIGKGYVTFQIKPKPGYAIGDIIPNTASIYFDFNPAIVTNTFNTEFVSTLSVANFESESFAVYPNPTIGVLTILSKNSSRSINNVVVSDVLGKTVQTNSFNSSKVVLDLSGLNSGVYFVKVQSEGVEKVLKIVKQ